MGFLYLVHLLFYALYLIVIAGVILSWVRLGVRGASWTYSPVVRLIEDLSDQICRPFRRLIAKLNFNMGPIDVSPILAILTINLLEPIILRLLFNIGIR